jgi:hypothetical protein
MPPQFIRKQSFLLWYKESFKIQTLFENINKLSKTACQDFFHFFYKQLGGLVRELSGQLFFKCAKKRRVQK